MKKLYESLLDDIDVLMTDTGDYAVIKYFLENNYKFKGKIGKNVVITKDATNSNIVNVNGNIKVLNEKLKSLSNGIFRFGKVTGNFDCGYCKSLKTLEGAPKEVGGNFRCNDCIKLKSLKGAPEKVGGDFFCWNCKSLLSLNDSPKEVGRDFECSYCKLLTSLEGASIKVGGNFGSTSCDSLISLEGAPKEVGGDFNCYRCGKIFKKREVKQYSKVKGKICC